MNRQEQEKIEKLKRGEKPGRFPFVSVAELCSNPTLIELSDKEKDWDSRYGRGTDEATALKYLTDKNANIVDYGCLFGRFLRDLQHKGFTNLHGIELVDVLDEVDRTNVKFNMVDVSTEAIPYPDNFFDAATSWGFLEHLENPHHFIREVHRTLKNDGLFICTFPNVEHLQTRLVFLKTGEMRSYEAHNNHIAIYSPGIFAKSFLRYFDIVEQTYFRPHLSFPPYGLFKQISKHLPNSKLFGDYAVYVLRKKPFVPFS